MSDGMKGWVSAMFLLAAAVLLGGCATSTKYALEQQAATGSLRIDVVDMRNPEQKRAEVMSMSITSCWYGVYRVGDEQTEPPRLTSCAEANYFLRHCPGVKMDGNNDGVPCEQQWCK